MNVLGTDQCKISHVYNRYIFLLYLQIFETTTKNCLKTTSFEGTVPDIKVKVKVNLEQVTKTQRRSRCIALLFLHPRR
jgi:hypothetical protein